MRLLEICDVINQYKCNSHL